MNARFFVLSSVHALRALSACAAAFAFVTAAWAIWGYFTPGDYFANGSSFVWPSLLCAFLAGLAFGWHLAAAPAARVILVFGVVASLAFWLLVPNGWWAHWPSHDAPHSP